MSVAAVRDRYLAAVRAGDRRSAFEVVDSARASGHDIRSLYLDVFQPVLREIGRLWQENEISVADEHLATAITQAAMGRLSDEVFASEAQSGRLLIAACADTERHEMGLRMICDLLEVDGWDTVFLGATVPIEGLVEMVRDRRPDVVALSASVAPHLQRVEAAILAIRAAVSNPPLIAVGGRLFLEDPRLAARLGADLTAADAAEAVRLLKKRLTP